MDEEILVPDELELEDALGTPEKVTVVVNQKGKSTERTYWVRPPDELEKTMAQSAARIRGRELRDKLIDPNSEEHQLIVVGRLQDMTDDEKRLVWLTANLVQKSFELNRRSLDDRDEYYVPHPEGKEDGLIPPTNAEMDAYEDAKRDAEKERLGSVQEQQNNLYKELKQQADELDTDDLNNIIEPVMIEQMTAEEWNLQYGMQILVRCTFTDENLTKRAFMNMDQALRLRNSKAGNHVLESLLAAHRGLMLDPDQLKN